MNNEPCVAEGCEKPSRNKTVPGYCVMHIQRLRTHGCLEPDPYVRVSARPGWTPKHPKVCTIDDCPRKSRLAGLCATHYHRRQTVGTVGGPIELRTTWKGVTCQASDCDREARTRGWCHAHYTRLWLTGDEPSGAIRPDNFAGDDVGYFGVHNRLTRWFGPAREHPCGDCGKPAAHWSYNHSATDERIDGSNGLPYSVEPDDYDPRCVRCHVRLDRGLAPYWQLADA